MVNRILAATALILAVALIAIIFFAYVKPNSQAIAAQSNRPEVISSQTQNALSSSPSQIKLSQLSVSPGRLNPGEQGIVTASVTNTGSADVSYRGELLINQNSEAVKELQIPAGATRTISFPVSREFSGLYEAGLGTLKAQFEVISLVPVQQTGSVAQSSLPSCCSVPQQTAAPAPVVPNSSQSSGFGGGGSCCGK